MCAHVQCDHCIYELIFTCCGFVCVFCMQSTHLSQPKERGLLDVVSLAKIDREFFRVPWSLADLTESTASQLAQQEDTTKSLGLIRCGAMWSSLNGFVPIAQVIYFVRSWWEIC